MKFPKLQNIKTFIDSSIKFDIQSLLAIIINCTFMIAYAYEGNLPPMEAILNVSVVIYTLCIISIAFHFKNPINKYLKVIWFTAILIGLGFFPAYSTLVTGGKKYVVLNLGAALLILAMIVEYHMFMLISIVGMMLAFFGYLITEMTSEVIAFKARKVYLLSYIFAYTFLSVSLFVRRNERRNANRMNFMKVFGGAIAHEVNTPLASVRMISDSLEMILQSVTVSNTGDKYLMELDELDYKMLVETVNPGLKKASNDAIQIVEMLLSALRSEYKDDKQMCSIVEIAEDAIYMTSYIKDLNIKLDIKEDYKIECNKLLMKHVIHNLIKNSIKHGGDGIEIKVIVDGSRVIVEDNGKGIDEEKVDKIFDAFFTSGNGHGIGLAFCKFALDDINGKIHCESRKGEYTRFIIQFRTQAVQGK